MSYLTISFFFFFVVVNYAEKKRIIERFEKGMQGRGYKRFYQIREIGYDVTFEIFKIKIYHDLIRNYEAECITIYSMILCCV